MESVSYRLGLAVVLVLMFGLVAESMIFKNYRGYYLQRDYVKTFKSDSCNNTENLCYFQIQPNSITRFMYNITLEARTATDTIQAILIISDGNNTYLDFRFLCYPDHHHIHDHDDHDQICPTRANQTYPDVNGEFFLNSSNIQPLNWNRVVDVMHYYYDNRSFPMAFFQYKAYLYDESGCDSEAIDNLLIDLENEITRGYELLEQLDAEDNILAVAYDRKLISLIDQRDDLQEKFDERHHHIREDSNTLGPLFKMCLKTNRSLENYRQHFKPRIYNLRRDMRDERFDSLIDLLNRTIYNLENRYRRAYNNPHGHRLKLFNDEINYDNDNQESEFENIDLFLQNLKLQRNFLQERNRKRHDNDNDYNNNNDDEQSTSYLVALVLNSIEFAENSYLIYDDRNKPISSFPPTNVLKHHLPDLMKLSKKVNF